MNSDQKRIIKKYSDRHRFWTDKGISQFGISTNVIFVISIGFLAFLINEEKLSSAI
jgi:hypothetical protein